LFSFCAVYSVFYWHIFAQNTSTLYKMATRVETYIYHGRFALKKFILVLMHNFEPFMPQNSSF